MDFYIVLGLAHGASLNDIKRAYKRLARRYHPDINPGDRVAAAQFRQIAEAYETLSDPDRRRRYDVHGPTAATADAQTFGFDGFDFSVSVDGADAPTFGDLFAEVFEQRTGARQPERGADLHETIELTFEEALAGGPRSVNITRQVHCRTCRGAGRLAVAETRCAHCHGTGVVKSARGHMVFSKACPHCGGQGRHGQAPCPTCGGRQLAIRAETLVVNVPAGLADGARVRVPSKGHAGGNGTESGDLYITLKVEPHPVFRRDGDDLHMTLAVGIHEAALGAKIDLMAPDGPARLRVPPGTQTGQRLRLRGRGIASPRDGRRGDLVVEVRLALPRLLDERSQELLREFGRINGADDIRDPRTAPEAPDVDKGRAS
ncbi:MAG TPA: J domain-containing protein [Vicinamibacterales bacterium]